MGRITNQDVLARLAKAQEHWAAGDEILTGMLADARAGLMPPEFVAPLEKMLRVPPPRIEIDGEKIHAVVREALGKLRHAEYADGRGGVNKVLLKPE